jgi:hypothetical protein
MDPDARCHAIASRQFGAIHVSQAERAGLSPAAVRRRVGSGLWRRVLPSVCAICAAPSSFEQRAMAAILYAGPPSALSGLTAAYLWGFVDDAPERIEIRTPRNLRVPGLVVHRGRLAPGDVVKLGPLVVTHPAVTLIDATRTVGEADLEKMLHRALTRRPGLRARLVKRLDAAEHRGHKGIRKLDELLSLVPQGPPESDFATHVFRALRILGRPYAIPEFPFAVDGARYRIDLFYRDEGLAVECDSREFHTLPHDFERERRKLNALQRTPWRVHHVTYRAFTRDRDGVVESVRELLGRPPYQK